jgi:hypothetical protein
MPLPSLPVHGLDDINHRRRSRETINNILNHQFDDSKVRTSAEISAGVTPVNYAYAFGDMRRYGYVGDGVTDDTIPCQNCSAVINAAGGGKIEFPPNSTAKVWVGASPNLFYFKNCTGIVFEGNGVTFTSGRTNGPAVAAIMLENCTKSVVRNITLQGSNTTLTNTTGELIVWVLEETVQTVLSNLHSKNCNTCVGVRPAFATIDPQLTGRARGIVLENLIAEDTYYGFACEGNGDDVRGNIKGINTARVYFPRNVRNHDIWINGQQEGGFSDVLIKCYGYTSSNSYSRTENIRVNYSSKGKSDNAVSQVDDDSLIKIELQMDDASSTCIMDNIDITINLDVGANDGAAEIKRIFMITKLGTDSLPDTTGSRGHSVNNIRFSGIVRNYQNSGAHAAGVPAIDLFASIGGMNWTGENLSNIIVENLIIGDSTAAPTIDGIRVNGEGFSSTRPAGYIRNCDISLLKFTRANWSAAFPWREESVRANSSYENGWISFTPTLTASVTNPTLGDSTLTARYQRKGDDIEYWYRLIIGSTFSAGSGTYRFESPVAARTAIYSHGSGMIFDASANFTAISPLPLIDGTARIQCQVQGSSNIGSATPITWATGDEIRFQVTYKA